MLISVDEFALPSLVVAKDRIIVDRSTIYRWCPPTRSIPMKSTSHQVNNNSTLPIDTMVCLRDI